MKIGDEIEWTHISQRSRTISMTLREGVIEQINGGIATVRTKSRRLTQVPISRLRSSGKESLISEFVSAMRKAHKP